MPVFPHLEVRVPGQAAEPAAAGDLEHGVMKHRPGRLQDPGHLVHLKCGFWGSRRKCDESEIHHGWMGGGSQQKRDEKREGGDRGKRLTLIFLLTPASAMNSSSLSHAHAHTMLPVASWSPYCRQATT